MGVLHVARRGDLAQFSPRSLPNLGLWLDASRESLVDGGAVNAATDLSGLGRHPAKAGGVSTAPTYKTAIVNGRAVYRFNGTADAMTIPYLFADTAGAALSVFAVAKVASTGTRGLLGTRSTAGWIWRLTATQQLYAHIGQSPNVTQNVTVTNWNVLEVVRNGLSIVAGVNGTMQSATVVTGFTATGASTTTGFGSEQGDGSSNRFAGDVAELIVVERAVTTAERDDIEAYLGAKYAITVA